MLRTVTEEEAGFIAISAENYVRLAAEYHGA